MAVKKTAICFAPVAQLDRASGYGPEGREFESSPARQKYKLRLVRGLYFFVCLEDSNRTVLQSKMTTFRRTVVKSACVPTPVGGWANLLRRANKKVSFVFRQKGIF